MKHLIRSILPDSAINLLRRVYLETGRRLAPQRSSAEYWTANHVDAPESGFPSIEASLDHLRWRNQMYPGHAELMPHDTIAGLTVLDYGCGPGNDVIGYGHYGKPARLIACDVSPTALALAKRRADLHRLDVELVQIPESPPTLPFEDSSIDVISSAGVLHHTPDPVAILREFRRVLKPGGEVRIMVYNRQSVWMHLYLSYVLMLEKGLYRGMTPEDAFRRTTDGDTCPIANCYRPEDFVALCAEAGFEGEFTGSAVSLLELDMLPKRWAALRDQRVSGESRDFIYDLRLDDWGRPLWRGQVAGLNAYYRLR